MIDMDNWNLKRTITQRTRPTTSAVALLGRSMVNWIITAEVVGLVLRVIVLFKFQLSMSIISGMHQLIGGNRD